MKYKYIRKTGHAIIYCRFSPRPNADECKSNDKQAERCRAYCEKHNLKPRFAYFDNAVSGKSLNRPGLSDAMEALHPGDVLVVDASDRLARDMLVCLTIRHQVEDLGCVIEFADGSPTTETPEGELFQNILAAFAAYERSRFARRTKVALAKKRADGEWHGKPPVGFRKDPETKRLVKDEGEQKVLAAIDANAARGSTSQWIALFVTANYGQFRGKPWSPRTIRKILARKKE